MFGSTKIGIMGTGNIAGIMADTIKNMRGVSCYAVGSRTAENASRFASLYGVKKSYGSYEELVNDPKVELIYVATPHSEHYENVKLALNAGKNVICEKAFMLNERQAKEVFDLAKEKNLLLTEAIWTRYMPMRAKINEVLASNVIGQPTMLTANLGYNVSGKDRISRPELGGGALLDLGVYVLNFASMVFGNDVTDIASICTFNELGMDMQDSITLRYRDGRMAVLCATAHSIADRSGVIFGTKGYIRVDNINNMEAITVFDNERKKIASYKAPKQITGYEYEILACKKALSENWTECPEMPHSESLKMLNMMDFIRRSNGIKFPGEDEGSSPEYETSSAHAESAYEIAPSDAAPADSGAVSTSEAFHGNTDGINTSEALHENTDGVNTSSMTEENN